MRNVFCFNGLNRLTWFDMGRKTKNDRYLIMGYGFANREKMRGQTPNEKFPSKRWSMGELE